MVSIHMWYPYGIHIHMVSIWYPCGIHVVSICGIHNLDVKRHTSIHRTQTTRMYTQHTCTCTHQGGADAHANISVKSEVCIVRWSLERIICTHACRHADSHVRKYVRTLARRRACASSIERAVLTHFS